MTVKDGAANRQFTRYGDAVFTGVGLSVGGGFAWNLSDHLILDARIKYHGGLLSVVKGIEGDPARIDKALNVRGLVPLISLSYVFH